MSLGPKFPTNTKDLKIYGADFNESAPALVFCDFVRKVVSIKNPYYIDNLLNISKKDQINLIIPTIDTDLLILSQNRSKFEEIGTKVLISDPDKIQICRDKNNTFSFFESCGLRAPIPVNNWKKYSGGFPAFIKPKDGSSSINAYKIDNMEELETFADRIDNYIVQPFISGREYTIDIFCDLRGNPISIVPRERIQIRAGEVYKTRIIMDQKMIEESQRICNSFKPCGPLTVQLIRDKDGIDWFIEINPRYGGGAPLSMKAGARSAETVLKMLDGESVEYFTGVEEGAIYSRFDQSVCVQEGKRKIRGVIFDLDDTLYSEKEYVRSGFRAVSEHLGGGFEEMLWRYFEEGKPAIDYLLKELRREERIKELLDVYRNHVPEIHLYEGVERLIAELRSKGYKVGIITDGRPEGQRKKIKALGLDVDDVIITDELGGIQFRKPCDIAFRIMMTKWKLPASDIVYVGDNQAKDFLAPQQLGMKSLCLKNDSGIYPVSSQDNGHRYKVVNSLTDIVKEVM